MKKIILSLILLLAPLTFFAQITHDIDWKTNTDGSLTINQGDTVRWTWGDALPHSVTSISGAESFDSGISSGMGTQFTHTFNILGDTDYRCDVHTGTMTGRITVQVLGIEDEFKKKTQLYPNPVTDILTIKAPNTINNIRITNIIGKKIFEKDYNGLDAKIDMTLYNSGMYFVQIKSKKSKQTLKVFKK